MKKTKTKPKPKAKAAPAPNLISPDAIVRWPLDRFIPYARNPRKNDEAVDRMAASIREFGFKVPILARSSGDIVDGHLRLKAAQKLELAEVPVLLCDEWSEAQVKAFRLLVNRSVAWADWDDELLSLEMADLSAFEYDLSLTGFDQEETSRLLSQTHVFGSEDEEETPEPPVQPVSVLGDLWVLGEHRVLCGDSTSEEGVSRLLSPASGILQPFLMVTDPPYGVEYDPTWRDSLDSVKRSKGTVLNDDEVDWTEAHRHFPGNVVYVWHAATHAAEVSVSLLAAGFQVRGQIIWRKPHFVIGRGHYHSQHEPCWYAVRKGQTAQWHGDRKQTTVWDVPNKTFQGGKQDVADERTGHGTQKPLELMRRPILNHTEKGEAVYDPFLGSGTTLIAAELTERTCYGLEIDPGYVDVIVQRWQKQTGKQATLEGDGRTFDELKSERLTA